MDEKKDYGTLYVVATPIGNLNDITFRAIEILKEVDLILVEDSRRSGTLLNHFKIATPMKSYRDQNHERVFPEIVQLLQTGKSLALISDSGTPLISDPGYRLVKDLINLSINISPIPGPSALVAALSISGLPTDKFTFLGFLPKGSGKRKSILEEYGALETTIVIYESPFRLVKLLNVIMETLGERDICVTNELTKKFEKLWHGKTSKLLQDLSSQRLKGEFTVVIAKETT